MTTTNTVSVAGSGLVFNNTFQSSVSAAYQNGIITAEQTLAGVWTNSLTLNMDFVITNAGNNGFLANNSWPAFVNVSYTALKNALASHAVGSIARQAVANLPANNPIPGSNNSTVDWALPEAYARMLGLSSSTPTFDDTVTVNSFYLPTNDQAFINAVMHEISEGGMGRVGGDGDQNSAYSTMDLFRYTASGQLDLTDGRDSKTTYLSYNGGSTTSQPAGLSFNNEYSGATKVNGGDPADFNQLDVFGVGFNGETFGLSLIDIQAMGALGWSQGPIISRASFAAIPASFDLSWTIEGVGGFNNDGYGDLVWQRASDGLVEFQLLQGTLDTGGTIANNPFNSAIWQVVGVGDFNDDGLSDLLYRRSSDGLTEIQFLSGTTAVGGGVIANNPFNGTWSVAGIGDFAGNGHSDLVWQQPTSGQVEIQLLNGTIPIGGGLIANNPFGAGWAVVATGDMNNDGKADLVWQRASDGLVEIQFLNSNNAMGGGALTKSPFGAGWAVVGAGDFLGNGKTDLVYQRQSDDLVEIQYLNGPAAIGGGAITNSPFGPGWQVVGVGNFNGDGKADLVYRDTATGTTEVQFLNGITPLGGGVVTSGSQLEAGLVSSTSQLVNAMAGFGAGGGALNQGAISPFVLDPTNQPSLAAALQHP